MSDAGPASEGRIPRSVAVVGLGLMGGSLARALRRAAPGTEIAGVETEPGAREAALRSGAVDACVEEAGTVLADADLVVYATPLGRIVALLEAHRTVYAPGAVVTDLGSLKGPVVDAAREAGIQERFVGGHPMTGGDASGFGASRDDLYAGATVYLTRDTGSEEARGVVRALWRALGCRVVEEDAETHDRRMVLASHLPQLLANALADTLAGEGIDRGELGPGGLDMTRLAGSSPELWRDLLGPAAGEDARALERLADRVEALADHLREGRIDAVMELMDRTRTWRGAGSAAHGKEGGTGP